MPSPSHLTPKLAEAQLDEILRELAAHVEAADAQRSTVTLREALERRLLERVQTHDPKRSSRASDELRNERLCRDLNGDLPVQAFTDGRLLGYFDDFVAEKRIPRKQGEAGLKEGRDVLERTRTSWTAQPAGSQAIEVATKNEAVKVAHDLGGRWKHRRPGCYRITPDGARRARRVCATTARALEADGWIVKQRMIKYWVELVPPSTNIYNKHRMLLRAAFTWAQRRGFVNLNPVDVIPRRSTRSERQKVLRREDFYTPEQVDRAVEVRTGP
ncbi:MAG: hypothetical protein ACRDK2_12415, partial [Solirubrobacteraceae bacterium]